MTFADAFAAHEHDEEQDRLAADQIPATDSLKMIRETLCVAQTAMLGLRSEDPRTPEHAARLQRLIDEVDGQRPLGPDGKHGNRHTPTCGCEDTPATDSERDERLRTLAALLLRHGHVDWEAHDARTVANAVMEGWADPLLAEQAATIERVRAVHTSPVQEVRFSDGFVDHVAVCVRCRVIAPCATAEALDATPTALGSHRMEGDRG